MGSNTSSQAQSQAFSPSQESEQAQAETNADAAETFHYSELDAFMAQSNEPESRSDEEPDNEDVTVAEEMTDEDAQFTAGFLVDSAASFTESLFSVPVTIDNDTRQVIAQKTVPVVIKYAKDAKLPPWVVKYREELELIGVVAMAGLSIYKQIKLAKASEQQEEPEQKQAA
ncbi:hypothetical protein [Pseudoalteromonas lipolytica]|nr:hypothetical protein [Pseudoalteromonas lipolytica]